MANSRSAKKRIRQNETRRLQNKAYRSMVRSAVKNLEAALKKGSTEAPAEKFVRMQKLMDTAARKGLVSRNAASRKVSRMAKRLTAKA